MLWGVSVTTWQIFISRVIFLILLGIFPQSCLTFGTPCILFNQSIHLIMVYCIDEDYPYKPNHSNTLFNIMKSYTTRCPACPVSCLSASIAQPLEICIRAFLNHIWSIIGEYFSSPVSEPYINFSRLSGDLSVGSLCPFQSAPVPWPLAPNLSFSGWWLG